MQMADVERRIKFPHTIRGSGGNPRLRLLLLSKPSLGTKHGHREDLAGERFFTIKFPLSEYIQYSSGGKVKNQHQLKIILFFFKQTCRIHLLYNYELKMPSSDLQVPGV